jgi:hypothetical protein
VFTWFVPPFLYLFPAPPVFLLCQITFNTPRNNILPSYYTMFASLAGRPPFSLNPPGCPNCNRWSSTQWVPDMANSGLFGLDGVTVAGQRSTFVIALYDLSQHTKCKSGEEDQEGGTGGVK